MKREHIAVAIFTALVVIVVYLFFRVLKPFLAPLIWGALLAIVFFPLNSLLAHRVRSSNARAFIMCAIVVGVIVLPAVLLAIGLVGELTNEYPKLKDGIQAGTYDFVLRPELYGWNEKIGKLLGGRIDTSTLDIESFIVANLDRLSKFAMQRASNLLANLSMAIVTFIFTVISMFYFFRDGDRFGARIDELLPMSEDLKANLITRMKEVVQATIYGGVLVAAVQGCLGGLIFWALGIQSPILWGAAMAFLALVPLFGPFLIYVPAGAIQILSGHVARGVILLALGIVFVSQADNVLKPLIIGRRTRLHQLLVFFSMLGGLKAFGLLGLILGPVLASVLLALLEVYKPHVPPIAPFP
jgi:predicted PurR-regulated permease PerM